MSMPASDRMAPPVRKRVFKITVLDVVVIGAVAVLIGYLIYRVNTELVYHWDWSRVFEYFVYYDEETQSWRKNLLIEGLIILVRICVWAAIFGLVLGLVMGVCRVSDVLLLRLVSRGYVEFVRNIPPVPFFFIMFFFVGNQLLKPLDLTALAQGASPFWQDVFLVIFGETNLLRNFAAAAIALALYEGAYITEIVRAGIQSIERGQWEAGQSLGLSRYQQLRNIILPQAVQRIAPPLANQSIQLIKDSALVSLLSVQELTFMGNEIQATTTRVFETWLTVGAMYFVVCYGLARLFARMERRMGRGRAT